jgi:hypothetical protein
MAMSGATSVRFVTEYDFITQLTTQVGAGFRLVPFIGSGCSSHSGILMGEQFNSFLAWTVFSCVHGSPSKGSKRWNLRSKGWPPPPSDPELRSARKWAFEEFCKLGKACGLEVDDDRRRAAATCPLRRLQTLQSDTQRGKLPARQGSFRKEAFQCRSEYRRIHYVRLTFEPQSLPTRNGRCHNIGSRLERPCIAACRHERRLPDSRETRPVRLPIAQTSGVVRERVRERP